MELARNDHPETQSRTQSVTWWIQFWVFCSMPNASSGSQALLQSTIARNPWGEKVGREAMSIRLQMMPLESLYVTLALWMSSEYGTRVQEQPVEEYVMPDTLELRVVDAKGVEKMVVVHVQRWHACLHCKTLCSVCMAIRKVKSTTPHLS
eukprot:394677-Amphidinium_carterae.2